MPIPKVILKLIPVPKSVVRSAIAGEFVTSFGLTDTWHQLLFLGLLNVVVWVGAVVAIIYTAL